MQRARWSSGNGEGAMRRIALCVLVAGFVGTAFVSAGVGDTERGARVINGISCVEYGFDSFPTLYTTDTHWITSPNGNETLLCKWPSNPNPPAEDVTYTNSFCFTPDRIGSSKTSKITFTEGGKIIMTCTWPAA
jgi:hypothetical protein